MYSSSHRLVRGGKALKSDKKSSTLNSNTHSNSSSVAIPRVGDTYSQDFKDPGSGGVAFDDVNHRSAAGGGGDWSTGDKRSSGSATKGTKSEKKVRIRSKSPATGEESLVDIASFSAYSRQNDEVYAPSAEIAAVAVGESSTDHMASGLPFAAPGLGSFSNESLSVKVPNRPSKRSLGQMSGPLLDINSVERVSNLFDAPGMYDVNAFNSNNNNSNNNETNRNQTYMLSTDSTTPPETTLEAAVSQFDCVFCSVVVLL